MKIKGFLKNISFAFLANIFSLLGSTLITFILPKLLGVTQYSYYQLYIFYTSYIGFFGFGWLEGIYLKYGGSFYERVDKQLINGQLLLFSMFELLISIFLFVGISIANIDSSKKNILYLLIICILIYLPRAFLHNLLQTTGRVKEHSIGVVIDKVVQIVLCGIGIILDKNSYLWYISSEILGRLFGGIYIFGSCKEIVFIRPNMRTANLKYESRDNIIGGVSLLISNIASLLVLGVSRQFIELAWDIETFGKISLTLSISNLLMVFINSIAMIIFPMLKRLDRALFSDVFECVRELLSIVLFVLLIVYFPMKGILLKWLPQYADGFRFMAILFPICIYECKMSLLINTYYKALRREKVLLLINLVAVVFSLIASGYTCFVLHDLESVVVSILLSIIFRATVAELILSKYLQIGVFKTMIFEFLLTILFVYSSWGLGEDRGVWIYLCSLILFFVFRKKHIQNVFAKQTILLK